MQLQTCVHLCSILGLDLTEVTISPRLAVEIMCSIEQTCREKDRAVEQVNPTAQNTHSRDLFLLPKFDELPF